MFGHLVLIPFLEGRRSPEGLEAQQRAEIRPEEVFSCTSSALGALVGLNQQIDHLLKNRTPEVVKKLIQSLPELDDQCAKNFAILISFAEKVYIVNIANNKLLTRYIGLHRIILLSSDESVDIFHKEATSIFNLRVFPLVRCMIELLIQLEPKLNF